MSAIRVLTLCAAVLLRAAPGPATGPGDAAGRQVRVGMGPSGSTGRRGNLQRS